MLSKERMREKKTKYFTPKQLEVIKQAEELEKSYGKNNVFIRRTYPEDKTMFIIHNKGERRIRKMNIIVNNRTLSVLVKKGFVEACDSEHRKKENLNYTEAKSFFLGLRIKTEKLKQEVI